MPLTRIGVSRWRIIGLWVCLGLASGSFLDRGEASQPYTPSSPDPVLESWRWRSFPELKGLGLRCMAEDKDGNMWFGVDEGVQRYDGVNWTAYTPEDGLLGAPVIVLCATRDGSVYAGTEMGISRFSEGTWNRAFPPEGDLPWDIHDLMEAVDGSLWAGTAWGALRLSSGGTDALHDRGYGRCRAGDGTLAAALGGAGRGGSSPLPGRDDRHRPIHSLGGRDRDHNCRGKTGVDGRA